MADDGEIERLRRAIPGMAEQLVSMMVDEALPMAQGAALSIPDNTLVAVSISYRSAHSGSDLKVTLSIGPDDEPSDPEET